jgi:hypothetical protein
MELALGNECSACHSEIAAKLLTDPGANFHVFSEQALILQGNLSDFPRSTTVFPDHPLISISVQQPLSTGPFFFRPSCLRDARKCTEDGGSNKRDRNRISITPSRTSARLATWGSAIGAVAQSWRRSACRCSRGYLDLWREPLIPGRMHRRSPRPCAGRPPSTSPFAWRAMGTRADPYRRHRDLIYYGGSVQPQASVS